MTRWVWIYLTRALPPPVGKRGDSCGCDHSFILPYAVSHAVQARGWLASLAARTVRPHGVTRPVAAGDKPPSAVWESTSIRSPGEFTKIQTARSSCISEKEKR